MSLKVPKESSGPKLISKAKPKDLSKIRAVAFDIDDTFSSQGKITDEAFTALWKLHKKGFLLVPVTGRPAGWCDHIARFWPVHAVVGENGAFSLFQSPKEKGKLRRLETPGAITDTADRKKKLADLSAKILARFPQTKFASDQNYRDHDLAIDFCEDVPRWADADVDALLDLCHQAGAHAKLSSIHVNTWFGEYDKWAGFTNLLKNADAWAPKSTLKWVGKLEHWIFLGDSPNDEPMFARFTTSAAMANLKPYLKRLKNFPTFLATKNSGAGFVEVTQKLPKKLLS